ncbi:glutaminase [Cryptosporangium minutisporangium]|uniref:glutaminase n=1 Tax=Cryptosporangium minutisporangium TaxID=113569 RepID=A0ABP6SX10_9ACTN
MAKPFVFALVCDVLGAQNVRRRLGVNATGLPFNSLAAVELGPDGRTNPLVNAGAIAIASLAPGDTHEARWTFLHEGPLRVRRPSADARRGGLRVGLGHQPPQPRAGRPTGELPVGCEPTQAVDLYTRQSCLRVTAVDLATMGATLANGGIRPGSTDRVVDTAVCHFALAVMATAGLYESSGDWLYDVGVPGKSGIGGGIVVVSPGKGALATFAPPLDGFGNSIRGQLAARYLSHRLGLTLFASEPTP